ncbi:MAG: hypothetical protein B6D72_01035 [gamma proteobacterium symbiont of Ctena orbiculata]|uniref:Uncharacterized protein n=1 Tax=Candidatus Thiodiazotropha taylori TaxID=2792791 RepID=A0A944M9B6_9GAMM|nr:hypothetical protein [Candidatus Thiodiazotropha taylori]PUB83247.1 MAG: hypothetical protein DBP00_16315 [gamma proteobacterium symbiont of Ctena orbiculata]MBT2987728.1 hypothetical protein [Candidatus Thiodiazotropha taylori]MBT2995030.1 hypothetical protein [Candidatus Thiodiazotropha taylori]MBT3000051.1 hypothetical protein [Candidatus Thiodiazotropha taylori]
METILAGILMLAPAIFFVLLIAGGIITVSMWVYAHLQNGSGGKQRRYERRSGIERRHTVTQ